MTSNGSTPVERVGGPSITFGDDVNTDVIIPARVFRAIGDVADFTPDDHVKRRLHGDVGRQVQEAARGAEHDKAQRQFFVVAEGHSDLLNRSHEGAGP